MFIVMPLVVPRNVRPALKFVNVHLSQEERKKANFDLNFLQERRFLEIMMRASQIL